jgi:carbon-monoxide dehydrogenase medium subunit
LDEFYTGVRKTIMTPDEIMTEIRFPVGEHNKRSAFFKLGLRRAQAISVVNAAVALSFDGEAIRDADITLGSVAPVVVHAREAEDYLQGKVLDEDIMKNAAELAMKAAKPIDDLRGSAAFREHMVKICVLRALRDLLNGEEPSHLPEEPVMLWGDPSATDFQGQADMLEFTHDATIDTAINGKEYHFQSGQDKSLLRLLREDAGLTGTKEGCAEGECGACTVYLDGAAVMACLVPAPRAHGAVITTIEGLAGEAGLHPVQQAFVDEGAVQCGYCTPGLIMSGAKLLEEQARPTRDEIAQALTGNLCRCTGYYKIIKAIERAASTHQE